MRRGHDRPTGLDRTARALATPVRNRERTVGRLIYGLAPRERRDLTPLGKTMGQIYRC